jgi:hypothetical protein
MLEASLYKRAHLIYLDQGQSLIVLECAAPHIDTHRQAMKFAGELPKKRRRTEVLAFYSGRPMPSAGTPKTLKT